MTLIATCPCCDEDVELDDDVEVNEVLTCKNCENQLELTSLVPLLLIEWEEEEK